MAFEDSAIEVLSVGDLIGQAVRLCWRNIHMILQALLVPAIGCSIGKICMYWPFTIFKTQGASLFSFKGALPSISLVLVAVVCVIVGAIVFLYSLWIMMLRQLALVRFFLVENKNQDGESYDAALRVVKSVQWAILGVFGLGTVAALAAEIGWGVLIVFTSLAAGLHVVPAWAVVSLILAEVLAMLVSIVLVSLVYWLAINEMIFAGKHVKSAISQSWTLAWPNGWRLISFFCLSTLVIILIAWPLSLPVTILTVVELFVAGHGLEGQNVFNNLSETLVSVGSKVPFYRLVLTMSWGSVVTIFTWTVMYFSWAVFYRDLKRRAFALDLINKVQKLSLKKAESGE